MITSLTKIRILRKGFISKLIIIIVIILLFTIIYIAPEQNFSLNHEIAKIEYFENTESIEQIADPKLTNDSTVQFLIQGTIDTRNADGHSTVYDYAINENSLDSILLNLDFHGRCDFYFKNLFKKDINWFVDPHKDLPSTDREVAEFSDFKNDIKWKKEFVKNGKLDVDPESILEEIDYLIYAKKKHLEMIEKSLKLQQIVIDYTSHVRIFNKCYVTQDDKIERKAVNKFIKKQKSTLKLNGLIATSKTLPPNKYLDSFAFDSCSEIESRIYPWMSASYPIFERFTGEIVMKPPNYKNYISEANHPEVFASAHRKKVGKGKAGFPKSPITNNKDCFLTRFKNNLNAKGIVLTIAEKHVDDAVRLIYMLRALDNYYPIQIVYFDKLSKESKNTLIIAARKSFKGVPSSFEKVKKYFSPEFLNENGVSPNFPKLELWFVNVYRSIHYSYRDKFQKFGNKMLASLFNSFEEYMLVDADTVPLKPIKYFFERPRYLDKGAFFYRDRTTTHFRSDDDGRWIEKVSPSVIDQVMFDIPIISDRTTSLPFFDGMGYHMESGLVLIDRNLHFNSVLMIVTIQLFAPTRDLSYGDKELFYLGFSINGDEGYEFNKYAAGGVGELTPQKYHGEKLKSVELCSCHPGHLNEDGKTLEWINSGFLNCGQANVNYINEFKGKSRFKWIKKLKDFKAFYQKPLKISHIVIPPFKNKWETHVPNVDGEPDVGWKMDKKYCKGYLWCGYSMIGGRTKWGSENTQVGKVVEFSEKDKAFFEYYGDIWSYAGDNM